MIVRVTAPPPYSKFENFVMNGTQGLLSWLRRSVFGVPVEEQPPHLPLVPLIVNYQFTRRCNYTCGFCFHTETSSFVLPLDEAKRGLNMLSEGGMEKVNFAGGEPFIHQRGRYLGELARFCKTSLHLPSVSIISNGSLITEKWFREFAEYIDIMAVSCDSFSEDTNKRIGRTQGNRTDHIGKVFEVKDWCAKYGVMFKINTVVNRYNWDEDMNEQLKELAPSRWKVFQCLVIEGENAGEGALRNAEEFVVSDEKFEAFIQRHRATHQNVLVPENNETTRNSYFLLDERMRFLNCQEGRKTPSKSLLDVGLRDALDEAGFTKKHFSEEAVLIDGAKTPSPILSVRITWIYFKIRFFKKRNPILSTVDFRLYGF